MCSPELTKGMCGICFGTLTDDNIYADEQGQKWDFHRGKCALLSGWYPDIYTENALQGLIALSHEYTPNSDMRSAVTRIYYQLVDLIAIEDYYDMSGP